MLSDLLVPPWVKPALAAVALVASFSAGWKVESLRWHAKHEHALKQAQIAFQRQLDKQQEQSEAYEQSRERSRVEGQRGDETIRTIYRDRIVPAECEPDPGVIGVLNDALRDANARAAGQPQG